MTHIVIIIFYCFFLAVIGICLREVRNDPSIIFFFLFIYLLKISIALVIYSNNMSALNGVREFSTYDSSIFYYSTLELLKTSHTLIPVLPYSIADPGYSVLLYWIGTVYEKIFGIGYGHYLYYLYFNVFIITIVFLLIVDQLKKQCWYRKKAILSITLSLAMFEPLTMAFGSILEREVVVALLLFLFFINFFNRHWLGLLFSGFLLVLFRKEYIVILPTALICVFIWKYFWRQSFLPYAILFMIGFLAVIHVAAVLNPKVEWLLFGAVDSRYTGAGLGAFIWELPYFFRMLGYSILGFVSPIPIYPVFGCKYNSFYVFALLSGIGSVFYLGMHLIIIGAIFRLERKGQALICYPQDRNPCKFVTESYIIILVMHMIFQGLIYNVRHKVQIMPVLIFLAMYCLQFYNIRGTFLNFFRMKKIVVAGFIISFLNIMYLSAKLLY